MRRFAAAVLIILIAATLGTVTAGPATAQQAEPIDTIITVDVQENGDAIWRVSNRYQLSSTEEQEAFSSIQQDIQQNQSRVATTFENRLQTSVVQAENETGRNMSIQNVSVTTERESFPDEYGVVTYEVTWTNFAQTTDSEIVIGDAIRGFYVSEGTQLTMKAPNGYTLTNVEPEPTSQSGEPARVVWDGPTAFTTDEPVLEATTNTGGPPTQLLIGVGVGLILLAGGVIAVLRRTGDGADESPDAPVEQAGSDSDSEDVVDADSDDLLTNEERILKLLDKHNGRMKQQTIVEETGWSDAKTSNVLSDLADDGVIDKFQLGRENVISLPDTEVDPTSDLYDEERDG